MQLGIERYCPLCKQVIRNAISDEELSAETEALIMLDAMAESDEEPCLSWESGMEN
jgi:hypothetical protein